MFKTKLILSVLAVLAVLTCTANTNVKKRIKMSYIKNVTYNGQTFLNMQQMRQIDQYACIINKHTDKASLIDNTSKLDQYKDKAYLIDDSQVVINKQNDKANLIDNQVVINKQSDKANLIDNTCISIKNVKSYNKPISIFDIPYNIPWNSFEYELYLRAQFFKNNNQLEKALETINEIYELKQRQYDYDIKVKNMLLKIHNY